MIDPWCKGHGKWDGRGREPHSVVHIFQIGAARITEGKDDAYYRDFEAYVLLKPEIYAEKIRDFPKCRFTPHGTTDARDEVAPHKKPRAALKRFVVTVYMNLCYCCTT